MGSEFFLSLIRMVLAIWLIWVGAAVAIEALAPPTPRTFVVVAAGVVLWSLRIEYE